MGWIVKASLEKRLKVDVPARCKSNCFQELTKIHEVSAVLSIKSMQLRDATVFHSCHMVCCATYSRIWKPALGVTIK